MSSPKILKKKLKAIVFTDIADFTKISAQDEQKALELIQKQNEIIKPIVEEYNGEWLKEVGDGLLLSYESSLAAVRCSIEIQKVLNNIDDLNIRIGIHQGDIFIKDGDIFGDDVNIASRIESFSPIGGISLSDKVHKDFAGVSDIKTSFIGHRKLKGIEQETKIRCVSSHNLPQYKFNKMPIIASYVCFFWAALSFVACLLFPFSVIWLKYAHPSNPNPESLIPLDILQISWVCIVAFMVGITHLLIGYSTLSFSRGISSKSQRFLVYLSYIFVILPFILLIFNPNQQNTFLEITEKGLPMILTFIFILVFIPSLIAISFKKLFSKKNPQLPNP